MNKTLKKIMSALLVAVMLVFSVPMGCYADMNWSATDSVFNFSAEAEDTDIIPVYTQDKQELSDKLGFDPDNIFFKDISIPDNITEDGLFDIIVETKKDEDEAADNKYSNAEAVNYVFLSELTEAIAKALSYNNSYIDIKAYEIPDSDAEALINAAKECFEATYGYSCDGTFTYDVVYDSHKNTIVKLKFSYGTDLDSSSRASTIDAEVNVLNEIKAYTNGMSDFDKAIYIHDYLILNGEYDIELSEIIEKTGTLTEELRTERYEKYALLVNGTGVCDTYATAYQYLMSKCGVECITVSGSGMNKSWNMVKLDGSWYHVDCRWDDPTANRVGLSSYKFFLLNDSEMNANERLSWTPYYTSSASDYSTLHRGDSDTVSYGDEHWCYYENGDLYYSEAHGKDAVKITDIDFSATDIYNGCIYGVIGNTLYKIVIDDALKEARIIYAFDEAPKSIYIDKNGILEYYTDNGRSFETVNLNEVSAIESLTVSSDTTTITNGEALQLKAIAHAGNKNFEIPADCIIWSSSDEAIATVNASGLVTPDAAGTVVITAVLNEITVEYSLVIEPWTHTIGGTVSDSISWSLDEATGTLSVYGSGEIDSFTSAEDTPWYKYRSCITSLDVSEGINGIGEYAFAGLNKIKYLQLPDSIEAIGEFAFNGWDALEKVEIPFVGSSRSASEAYDAVFGYIFGKTSEGGTAQYYKTDGTNMTGCQYAIPEGIKEISITDADIISFGAFYGMTSLQYLALNNEITYINDRILAGCSSIVSIKVPFLGSNVNANGKYDSVVGYFFGGTDNGGTLQYTSYTASVSSIRLYGYYYDIPETFKDIEITNDPSIPVCAFSNISLGEILLREATTEIGELAFYSSSTIDSLIVLNKDCVINDSYYQADFDGTVYGYSNSTAQHFANLREIDFVAIDAGGCPHAYSIWTVRTSPTCELQGLEYRVCNICYTEVTRSISSLGHNFSEEWTTDVEVSCGVNGSKSRHCTRCSSKTDITPIVAPGHQFGDWALETEPTCSAEGIEVRICSVCNGRDTRNIAAIGHTPSTELTIDKEATCSENGEQSNHCLVCDAKLNVTVIPSIAHSYGKWTTVKNATCTKKGSQKRACKICGYEKTRATAALGHTYVADSASAVEATCTTEGKTIYICHCGSNYVETTEALGHKFEDGATCLNCNFDRTADCSCNCHKTGFSKFIFKMALFFQKLFKNNKECTCGVYHY